MQNRSALTALKLVYLIVCYRFILREEKDEQDDLLSQDSFISGVN